MIIRHILRINFHYRGAECRVDMPVTENNATILKKLDIKPITAQLIDYLEKDFNNFSLDGGMRYRFSAQG